MLTCIVFINKFYYQLKLMYLSTYFWNTYLRFWKKNSNSFFNVIEFSFSCDAKTKRFMWLNLINSRIYVPIDYCCQSQNYVKILFFYVFFFGRRDSKENEKNQVYFQNASILLALNICTFFFATDHNRHTYESD
jgi:hypothetical protein